MRTLTMRAVLAALLFGGILASSTFVATGYSLRLGLAVAVGGTVFLGVISFWHWKELLWNKIDYEGARIEEIRSVVQLQNEAFVTTVPWSSWALSPVDLVDVMTTIELKGATTIVECGCGVSTLFIAQALKKRGHGRIISLEHDGVWAEKVTDLLHRNGLDNQSAIVTAPLQERTVLGRTTPWYGLPENFLADLPEIDLLLIDGPPASISREIRFPALPLFWDHLAATAVIYLDDARRSGEQRVLEHWSNDFPIQIQSQARGANSAKLILQKAVPNPKS